MFRQVQPGDPPELPMRMLFHPVGDGVYLNACEAEGISVLRCSPYIREWMLRERGSAKNTLP